MSTPFAGMLPFACSLPFPSGLFPSGTGVGDKAVPDKDHWERNVTGPSNSKLKQWMEIAQGVTRAAGDAFLCPECRKGSVKVRDYEYGEGQAKGVARYLYCTECGALNVSNVSRAGVSSR